MAKFFKYFPQILYTQSNNSSSLDTVTNIMARFAFEEALKNNSAVFYDYDIREGQTPEEIAHKYYGNSEYHWIVLMFNNIIDPYYDWPMESSTLNAYINAKYSGIDNIIIVNGGEGYSNGFLSISSTNGVGGGANVSYTVNSTGAIINIVPKSRGSFYNQDPIITASIGSNAIFSFNEITSYSGLSWAQNIVDVQAYYKLITRVSSYDGTTITEKFQITSEEYANTGTTINNYMTQDGLTSTQTITTAFDTFFDYEYNLNESKRKIKLLKPEYVEEVVKEFKNVIK